MVSAPAPPSSVSLPPPPVSTLMPLLPVMTLASPLPVPLMLALPVRVRFSTLAPSVKLTDDCTVSVPALSASVTTSPTLSTM